VHLFHYHLVTSKVRDVEARYIAKLGFRLVARYGRIGDEQTHYESGVPWEELDRIGFRLRLSELERGAVNVVVQPGQWDLPRLDHIGLALDDDEFDDAMARAKALELRVQEYPGRRTFVATGAGYRVEVHPPRDWIEELLDETETMRLAGLRLKSEDPESQAAGLAQLFDLIVDETHVQIGDSFIRFVPGGPPGRPQLDGELFA
jgi:catechol 2,3-dioxygenase-like lactoylglutathione lyase family enzyme